MKNLLFTYILLIISNIALFSQGIEIKDITCEEAVELIKANQGNSNFIILDTRTEEMFNKSHLKNAIVYDVYNEGFNKYLETLDKSKIYLIYCTSGVRSAEAVEKMKEKGFGKIYHMFEGISTWRIKNFETISVSK
jgi:rhodanese-related sulfurtransferase